jgi:hypothetical protein
LEESKLKLKIDFALLSPIPVFNVILKTSVNGKMAIPADKFPAWQ